MKSALLFVVLSVMGLTGCVYSESVNHTKIMLDGASIADNVATVLIFFPYSASADSPSSFDIELDERKKGIVFFNKPLKFAVRPGVHTLSAPMMGGTSAVTQVQLDAGRVYYFKIYQDESELMDTIYVAPVVPQPSYTIPFQSGN